MNLTISSWFNSVDAKITISFKVLKFLREQIIDQVLIKRNLYDQDASDDFYNILITSNKFITDHQMGDLEFDEKNKMKCIDFVFSLKKIERSNDKVLEEFLNGFYNLLAIFFTRIQLNDVDIQSLKSHAFYELVGNIDYRYEESSISSDLANFAEGLDLDD